MANSRRHRQLENRIQAISRTFIPTIKPSGNYTKKEQDNIRAYLLLSHAEIESYLEEISETIVKSAFKKWKDTRTKSNVLLSLVSFNENKMKEQNIEERINKALSTYLYGLRNNHGIKEKNVLSILLPIGYEYDDIDQAWLNTITSFGKSRGEIAHTAAKVQQPIDPITLQSTIGQVLDEIKNIDVKLRKLK